MSQPSDSLGRSKTDPVTQEVDMPASAIKSQMKCLATKQDTQIKKIATSVRGFSPPAIICPENGNPFTRSLTESGEHLEEWPTHAYFSEKLKKIGWDKYLNIPALVKRDYAIQDIQGRTSQLALSACIGQTPTVPIIPLTPALQSAWPDIQKELKFTGDIVKLNYAMFQKLLSKYPLEIFQELKARTLLSMGLSQLNDDLFEIIENAFKNIGRLHEWVQYFGTRELATNDDINRASLAREQAEETARALRGQITDLEEEVEVLQAKVDQAAEASSQELQERDDRINLLLEQIARMANTPSVRQSIESGPSRSAKVKDPPVFTNDKASTGEPEVKFTQWYMLLKNKLTSNADHFTGEEDRVAYILNRMGGSAAEAVMPFVYSETDDPPLYTTQDEVMTYLESAFKDHNAHSKARAKFRDLRMTTDQKFTAFRLTFVQTAGSARIPQSEYKEQLNEKLPPRLNTKVVNELYDENVNFEDFCVTLQRHDHTYHINQAMQRQAKPTGGPTGGRTGGTGGGATSGQTQSKAGTPAAGGTARNTSQPAATPAAGSRQATPAVSAGNSRVIGTTTTGQKIYAKPRSTDDYKELLGKGLCFTCHESGHRGSECPYKDEAQRLHEAQVNAAATQMAKD